MNSFFYRCLLKIREPTATIDRGFLPTSSSNAQPMDLLPKSKPKTFLFLS